MASSATTETELTTPGAFNTASGASAASAAPESPEPFDTTQSFNAAASPIGGVIEKMDALNKGKQKRPKDGYTTLPDNSKLWSDVPQMSIGDAFSRFFSLLMKLFSGDWEGFELGLNGPGGFKDTYVDPVQKGTSTLPKEEQKKILELEKTIERARLTLSPNMDRIERLQALTQDSGIQKLLNVIKKYESRSGDYDIVNGSSRPLINGKPLSQATLREVMTAQITDRHKWPNAASAAVGAYQVIPGTLEASIKRLGLNIDTTVFDKQTQDLIAMDLLENRGLTAHISGQKDKASFMKEIAYEWASLPLDSTGRAAYGGKANNPYRVSPDVVREVHEALHSLPIVTRS